MKKSAFEYYKIPALIAFVLTIVLLALNLPRNVLDALMVVIAAVVGIFALDAEYLIHAYILEPERDFSKTLRTFIKHGDIKNAIEYINFNQQEIKENTLNSAVFQIILVVLCVYVVTSTDSILGSALVLHMLAQSLYRFSEYYYGNRLADWFWILKEKPTKAGAMIYAAAVIFFFVVCLAAYS